MDEYLFIAMAKLRADLRHFERLPASVDGSTAAADEVQQHRSVLARRSAPAADVSWVVPAHGMRGWS